jgi:hypothetical protein
MACTREAERLSVPPAPSVNTCVVINAVCVTAREAQPAKADTRADCRCRANMPVVANDLLHPPLGSSASWRAAPQPISR